MTESPHYWRTYEPLKFLGRFFWVPMTVAPHTEPVSYAATWEDTGERWAPTIVTRIPLTRLAIGVGIWLDAPPLMPISDDADFDAYVAVNGSVDREEWQAAREEIADLGLDPDDEMAFMQAKGIFE